mmetsp:Transcript_35504/g.60134  ORF Transcript_35504/g.60134 Transcript_35504/m.60134 type:complete len:185 (-) Transcript_35504:561-1115(-)
MRETSLGVAVSTRSSQGFRCSSQSLVDLPKLELRLLESHWHNYREHSQNSDKDEENQHQGKENPNENYWRDVLNEAGSSFSLCSCGGKRLNAHRMKARSGSMVGEFRFCSRELHLQCVRVLGRKHASIIIVGLLGYHAGYAFKANFILLLACPSESDTNEVCTSIRDQVVLSLDLSKNCITTFL